MCLESAQVGEGKVLAELVLPDGSFASKDLPSQHKDLRPMLAGQGWTSEEQDGLRREVWELLRRPTSAGSTPSREARAFSQTTFGCVSLRFLQPGKLKHAKPVSEFLWKSQLPRAALKQALGN